MLNPESFKKDKQKKSIKNIYIHKINSLLKIVGDSNSSLPCLSKARKNMLLQSHQHLALQRKQNNKDAARKARLRKKIYMELLESTIENLQKLNEQGKMLQKSSNQLLTTLKGATQCKQEDQIDKYLMEIETQKNKKQTSQSTMDLQKGSELKKIMVQIQMLSYPQGWKCQNLFNLKQTPQTTRLITKMQGLQHQLPQLFIELRNICSQHSSLLALSSSNKNQYNVDPYFCKTLMEEYFSKTLCRKDAIGLETQKQLSLLTRMEKYKWRAQQINESDFLVEK